MDGRRRINPRCKDEQKAANMVLQWRLPEGVYSAFQRAVREHGVRAVAGFHVGYGKFPRQLWHAAARDIGQDS
jgi:hypothetical protein